MPDESGRTGVLPPITSPSEFAAAFGVSRETTERLVIFADLLAKWQKTINLVAPGTLDVIWRRHFADSAQLLRLAPVGARNWADLGSGAGFPGLVLALLRAGSAVPAPEAVSVATEFRAVLVESDTRKCAFLAEVVRKTGLGGRITVEIVNDRIEKAATRASLSAVDVVTARALAPLDRLLGLSRPYFTAQTVGLFLKGREVEAEIEEARRNWAFDLVVRPSRVDAKGRIVEIRGLKAIKEG